jgi:hypothetical protein
MKIEIMEEPIRFHLRGIGGCGRLTGGAGLTNPTLLVHTLAMHLRQATKETVEKRI